MWHEEVKVSIKHRFRAGIRYRIKDIGGKEVAIVEVVTNDNGIVLKIKVKRGIDWEVREVESF